MNWVYLHLTINHIPIVLGGLGAMAALFAILSGRRLAWLYTAITLTLGGLSVYPVFVSGDRAARIVRQREPQLRQNIKNHDQSAEKTLWVVLGAGVLGLVCWYRLASDTRDAAVPGWVKVALAVPALASAGALVWTSQLGGKIGHESWETSLTAAPALSADSLKKLAPDSAGALPGP